MLKFGRTYTLTVQGADGEFHTFQNPLTIDFSILRNTLASASTANIKIMNLGAVTRNLIYKDRFDTLEYRKVELHAGYGRQQSMIFSGNIKEAKSYREEGATETVTEIDAYDGGFAMVNNYASRSYAAGTPRAQVINGLVSDMGPTLAPGAVSVLAGTYPRGKSIMGPTWQQLVTESGQRAFIDNGRIYVLDDDEAIVGDAFLITAETGLLGSPKRSGTFVTCEILFEPRLVIGQRVELISRFNSILSGFYKVMGIQHAGTISDAVNGKLKTIVSLWVGTKTLRLLQGQGAFQLQTQ